MAMGQSQHAWAVIVADRSRSPIQVLSGFDEVQLQFFGEIIAITRHNVHEASQAATVAVTFDGQ